jgi:membrane peptidoglycan carboxypeptidase
MKKILETHQIPMIRNILTRLQNDLSVIEDRRTWVDPNQPLMLVEKMILILEDRNFFWHNGVDVKACIREVLRILTLQRHGGASTIDMQFVRTATGFRDKTFRRKLYEMFLAVLIQTRFRKLEILRSYLACAFFGSRLYGLQNVSRKIYKSGPKELGFHEAAEVAAMLVYPRPLEPTPKWQIKIDRRAKYVTRQYPKFEKRYGSLFRSTTV